MSLSLTTLRESILSIQWLAEQKTKDISHALADQNGVILFSPAPGLAFISDLAL